MEIEAKEFNIKMSHSELWSTAFDIQRALETTLKDHWVNHQNVWLHHEKERLDRSRNMFLALGRPELHEQIFDKANKIFEDFNKKKVTKFSNGE